MSGDSLTASIAVEHVEDVPEVLLSRFFNIGHSHALAPRRRPILHDGRGRYIPVRLSVESPPMQSRFLDWRSLVLFSLGWLLRLVLVFVHRTPHNHRA